MKKVLFSLPFLLLLGHPMAVTAGPQAPATVAATGQQQPRQTNFLGEPVSLKLVDVSLVDFFRTVSELSGLNILIDPDVAGSITINVEEVPWDQLFEVVLKSQRLRKRIEGNIVRISTQATVKSEDDAQRALKEAAFLAQDTITVAERLNYGIGTDLVTALEEQLSPRGKINVDERTNTLIITDVPDSVQNINRLLVALDIPERQVEIEARIIEATSSFARSLGVEFNLLVGAPGDRSVGIVSIFAPATGAIAVGGISSGKLLDTVKLDAFITAAETDGRARILSKPRVSAQNNAEAIITQGSKIPIPVQQNFTTTVRFETAALQLTVTPQITDEDTVILSIRVQNNIPDFSRTVLGIPTILTSESQTQVMVRDGGTTVLGGIFVEQDRSNETRVPGLGSIPLLGHLFKRQDKSRDTREILFFITPRIMKL